MSRADCFKQKGLTAKFFVAAEVAAVKSSEKKGKLKAE